MSVANRMFNDWWTKHGDEFEDAVVEHLPEVKNMAKAMYFAGIQAAWIYFTGSDGHKPRGRG